jgi:hypothetical protein
MMGAEDLLLQPDGSLRVGHGEIEPALHISEMGPVVQKPASQARVVTDANNRGICQRSPTFCRAAIIEGKRVDEPGCCPRNDSVMATSLSHDHCLLQQ